MTKCFNFTGIPVTVPAIQLRKKRKSESAIFKSEFTDSSPKKRPSELTKYIMNDSSAESFNHMKKLLHKIYTSISEDYADD